MEGLEYLERGDLKKVAEQLGLTGEYISMVIHGKRRNIKVTEIVTDLIEKRKEKVRRVMKMYT